MSTINGTSGDDQLAGTTGGDTINGLDGDDILYGDAGNDTLNGGNGDDFLEGGAGNDKLDGGSGFNFADYIVATAGVTVSLSLTTAQNTVGAGTDTLANIQGIIGSDFNDVLTGDANANILDGGKGLDTLHGGGGNDVLQESRISTAPLTGTFDGGDGYDTLAQEGDVSGATLISIEEIDSQFLTMTAAQTVGIQKLTAQHIVFTTGGTIDLDGVTFAPNPNTMFPITMALNAAPSLDLSGTLGGAAFAVTATAGNDTIHAGGSGAIIVGGGGSDMLTGGDGNDTIDTLGGVAGIDNSTIDGGAGDDALRGGNADDTILGGAGSDSIIDDDGKGTLSGGDGNDFISGGFDLTVIHGDAGDDRLTLSSDAAGSVVDGGAGNDLINFASDVGAVTALGSDGNDEIDISAVVAGVTIDGGAGDDLIVFKGAQLSGVQISGGTGHDILSLGDTDLSGAILDGQIEEIHAGKLTVAPGELAGVQTLSCFFLTLNGGPGVADLSALTFSVSDGVVVAGDGETLKLGPAATGLVIHITGSNDTLVGTTQADGIFVTGPAANVHGGDGNDQITGGTGADKLLGDGGDDIIVGGDGNNNMSGGDGNDTITAGIGNDKIAGDAGNDNIDGSAGNDTLSGGDGDDILNPGPGNDLDNLDGGAGNDTIYASMGTMKGGDGIDTLIFTVGRDISHETISGFETLEVWNSLAPLTMRGSQLSGVTQIVSSAAIQFSTGGAITLTDGIQASGITFLLADANTTFDASGSVSTTAHLTIVAGAGADHITGGTGNDFVVAGSGADTIDGGDGTDGIVTGAGRDIIHGGAGDDYLSISAAIQTKEIYDGGDGYDHFLIGFEHANLSPAQVVNYEVLVNDTHTAVSMTSAQALSFQEIDAVNNGIALTTGGAVDFSAELLNLTTIQLSNFATTLILPGSGKPTAPGFAITGGTHNDDIGGGSSHTNAYAGMGGDDTLGFTGGAAGRLDGGDGDDTLSGGQGNDTIVGGAGRDLIHVSTGTDTVDGGSGVDTLSFDSYKPGVTLNLSAGTFSATGISLAFTGIENLTGGVHADVLTGDGGANMLSGGDGNDVLTGGAGIDSYSGGANRDTFVFAGSDLAASIGADTAERILDFSHTDGDRMDLSGLDAITGGADDPFAFIGTAAFDHHAGELRYKFSGATTLVMGDVNGDGVADFYIKLDGNIALAAGDFVL